MDVDRYFEELHKGLCENNGCGGQMALVVVLLLFLLCSCKQVEYVTVEKVRVDTTYVNKLQKDSVWMHDSVYVKEKGDSVWVERWHTKYETKEVHDTLYKARVDSIPVPYWKIKEVAAELSWWQKLRLWLGNVTLVGLLAIMGYGAFRLWKVYKFF